jgi:hypothetical protein
MFPFLCTTLYKSELCAEFRQTSTPLQIQYWLYQTWTFHHARCNERMHTSLSNIQTNKDHMVKQTQCVCPASYSSCPIKQFFAASLWALKFQPFPCLAWNITHPHYQNSAHYYDTETGFLCSAMLHCFWKKKSVMNMGTKIHNNLLQNKMHTKCQCI